MAHNDTTVIQMNFKVGTDLHNLYATNGAEAAELLDFFETDLLPRLASVSQKAAAVAVVANAIPVAPAATQTPPAAATPPAAESDAGAHICDHGQPMRLVPAGISKATGKPYRGFYACNQPRGMQCDKKVTI